MNVYIRSELIRLGNQLAHCLDDRVRRFPRQEMARIGDHPPHVRTAEKPRVPGRAARRGHAVGSAMQHDGGHADVRRRGQPLLDGLQARIAGIGMKGTI